MRIDPRMSIVPVGTRQVQVGNGPRAVVLDVGRAGVRTLLAELQAGRAGTAEQLLPALSRRTGLDPAELNRLLAGLEPVLDAGPGPAPATAPRTPPAVHVDGLGPTGRAVVELLAADGACVLSLTDPRPVRPGRLGFGLLTADIGRPRATALTRRLGERGVRAVACHAGVDRPAGETTVLVRPGAWEVDRLARAQAGGHPVLPVTVRDEDTLVGPWCAPDSPGCPLCWERWAEQEDPLRAERTAALRRAEAGRDTLSRAVLTAAVTVAVLEAGPVPGTAWRVREDGPGGAVATEQVAPWPGCGCAG